MPAHSIHSDVTGDDQIIGRAARPLAADGGAHGVRPLPGDGAELPQRKAMNHRGPLSIDVSGAWYFITICADGHQAWTVGGAPRAPRDATWNEMRCVAPVGSAPRAPRDATCRVMSLADAAKMILTEAREYHLRGCWRLALMLVMPDHLHFIVHVPDGGAHGVRPLPGATNGAHGVRPLPRMIGDFKRLLTVRYGLRFQRDFWDTRLRDDAHYAEKFNYICNNPVRKGLCRVTREWSHVIVFARGTGEKRRHR